MIIVEILLALSIVMASYLYHHCQVIRGKKHCRRGGLQKISDIYKNICQPPRNHLNLKDYNRNRADYNPC